MSNQPATSISRLSGLDGLRGLASIMVAINHSFLVISVTSLAALWNQSIFTATDLVTKINQVFNLIGNGGAAVSIFFVLSGYVLFQSLERDLNYPRPILRFYLKRFFRIYPLYFVVILLTFLYLVFFHHYTEYQAASTWYHWWYNYTVSLGSLLSDLTFGNLLISGVTWTLKVEVFASIIFPILFLLHKQLPKLARIIFFLVLLKLSFMDGIFREARYVYMFYLGFFVTFMSRFLTNLNISKLFFNILIPPATFFLLYSRYQMGFSYGGLIESTIAFLFISLIISQQSSLYKLMGHKVLVYLGQISYGVYLIHFSVLYILVSLMFATIDNELLRNNYLFTQLGVLTVSLMVTIPLSHLAFQLVEQPMIDYGKRKIRSICDPKSP